MQSKVRFLCPWGMLPPKHLLLDFCSVMAVSVMVCNDENMGLKVTEALIPAPPY